MESGIEVLRLTRADAGPLWELRLEGLVSSPEAFRSSADEHRALTVDEYWDRLDPDAADAFVFGAFIERRLVGMIRVTRERRVKRRHIALVESLFVRREARGRGVGRALVARAIAQSESMSGLASLQLVVATGQEAARTLYLYAGFRPTGIEPKALRVEGRYIDEEFMVLDLAG